MKNLLVILIIISGLSACTRVSNKSIAEKLTTEELASSIQSDTSFASFYAIFSKAIDEMDDIKKAKFSDINYRQMFSYYKFLRDTAYWQPKKNKWEKEWKIEFGKYIPKAQRTLNYWKKYARENSLNRYVEIELVKIDKEYFEYVGGLREVNLGFKLTPLKGTIEQICFNYGFIAKINGSTPASPAQSCISTSPFSVPTIRYWKVPLTEQEHFSGETAETFLRDYNLSFTITSIRKDDVNISVDDFKIPKEVSEYLDNEKNYPELLDLNRDDLIKSLINKKYIGKNEFISKKADEIRREEDERCFEFLKEL